MEQTVEDLPRTQRFLTMWTYAAAFCFGKTDLNASEEAFCMGGGIICAENLLFTQAIC